VLEIEEEKLSIKKRRLEIEERRLVLDEERLQFCRQMWETQLQVVPVIDFLA
jgi:hypothetical protein